MGFRGAGIGAGRARAPAREGRGSARWTLLGGRLRVALGPVDDGARPLRAVGREGERVGVARVGDEIDGGETGEDADVEGASARIEGPRFGADAEEEREAAFVAHGEDAARALLDGIAGAADVRVPRRGLRTVGRDGRPRIITLRGVAPGIDDRLAFETGRVVGRFDRLRRFGFGRLGGALAGLRGLGRGGVARGRFALGALDALALRGRVRVGRGDGGDGFGRGDGLSGFGEGVTRVGGEGGEDGGGGEEGTHWMAPIASGEGRKARAASAAEG